MANANAPSPATKRTLYTAFDLDSRTCDIRTADHKALARVLNRKDLTDGQLVAAARGMAAYPELLEACQTAYGVLCDLSYHWCFRDRSSRFREANQCIDRLVDLLNDVCGEAA